MVADIPWKEDLHQSIDATLSKNNRLRRLMDENTRDESIVLADGTQRDARAFKLPKHLNGELFSSIERMVKAFYFMQFGQILVEHYELSIFHPEAIHPSLAEKLRSGIKNADVYGVNNDTVLYAFFNPQGADIVCVVDLFSTMQLFFVMKELGWREKAV